MCGIYGITEHNPTFIKQFIDMCKEVHSIDYNFLLMDFAPKAEHFKFRSGWDTLIQPKIKTEIKTSDDTNKE